MLCMLCYSASGVVDPPEIRRVCLNNYDSVATIEWTSLVDACGSFSTFHIYGRKNADPFKLLGKIPDVTSTSYQVKLPDTDPSWSFYLEVLNTCDGTDSVATNIKRVDSNKPPQIGIDSVSVDFSTQKIIIGWQPNPAIDTKGYRIFRYNNSVNTTIGDTTGLSFSLLSHDINVPIAITLATFDSCDLFSTASNPHMIMQLDSKIDTCANEIHLDWTAYQGWTVEKYGVYVSKNGSPYTQHLTVNGLNHIYSDFTLGDNICFFVRAYKLGDNITSSSKYVCFSTRKPLAPSNLYLSNVTVNGESIFTEWQDQLGSDIDSFSIERATTGSFTPIFGTKRNGSINRSFTDNQVDVNTTMYRYQVVAYDKCKKELARSNEAGNILLTINDDLLEWNKYSVWFGQLDRQEVWAEESSTWNMIASAGPDDLTYSDKTSTIIERCYQVRAFESGNPNGVDKASVSNKVCRIGELVFYIPNAINPKSENNTLKVIGQYIDYELSSFSIYNRWGQKIFETFEIDKGWDGSINQELVPMGIYFYVADIWGLNGERQSATGEIRIIR